MAKIKKTFDRELMYQKIMPASLKKETEEARSGTNESAVNASGNNFSKEAPVFQDRESNIIQNNKIESSLYNITEKLVLSKLDVTLKKVNCCKCQRCRMDITAIAMNNLKPMYIVATDDEVKEKIHELKEMGKEATTEVIKAVLIVRKNPRH